MTTSVLSYSENPNLSDKRFEREVKKEKSKKKIIEETWKNISLEEWRQMSWKDLEEHIEIDDKWSIIIFWKSLDYWVLDVPHFWTEEQKNWLDKYLDNYNRNREKIIERIKRQIEQISLMKDIVRIWQTEAVHIANSVWFKWIRDDDEKILWNVEKINKIIQIWVPINEEILKENFEKIFSLMLDWEKEENIIGEDDMQKVKEIFFDKKLSKEEKEIKIFNLMRYWGLSWNSETIKDIVANKLLEKKEFEKEKEILENPKLREYLEDEDIWKLREILSWEQADKALEIYQKTKEKLEIALKQRLGEENEKRQKEWKTKEEKRPLSLEEFKKLNNFTENSINITLNTFKHILISEKLDKKWNRWNENKSFEWMYANMIGLAETKGIWDYFTFADENIDNLIDFWVTLAIWAITMSAWIAFTVWARAFITTSKMVNIWNKVSKWLRFAKYVEKWTKSRSILWFTWGAVLDWVTFHEWASLMQNILFWDFERWKHQALDTNEIIKSIAFMWGLNSLQYISRLPWMAKIMDFKMKIPKQYLDKNVMLKVLEWTWNFTISWVREWTIMFGISQVIEQVLWNWWNPTVEEYLQFVALIQLMHLKDVWIWMRK